MNYRNRSCRKPAQRLEDEGSALSLRRARTLTRVHKCVLFPLTTWFCSICSYVFICINFYLSSWEDLFFTLSKWCPKISLYLSFDIFPPFFLSRSFPFYVMGWRQRKKGRERQKKKAEKGWKISSGFRFSRRIIFVSAVQNFAKAEGKEKRDGGEVNFGESRGRRREMQGGIGGRREMSEDIFLLSPRCIFCFCLFFWLFFATFSIKFSLVEWVLNNLFLS